MTTPIFAATVSHWVTETTPGVAYLHGRHKHLPFNVPVFVEPEPGGTFLVYPRPSDSVFRLSDAAPRERLRSLRGRDGQLVGDPDGVGAGLANKWKQATAAATAEPHP